MAGVVSAAICVAVMPCDAVSVSCLHQMDGSSAALVNTLWRKCHGIQPQPEWLQTLTGTTAITTLELPSVLVAACSTPEYDHVLRQAMKHAPHMLQLQDASGSSILHHMLGSVVLRGQSGRESAFSTLSQQLEELLYAGVPLHLVNQQNQTATKTARLAIQRHRADNPDEARRQEGYLWRVESMLGVIEKLQAAGTSVRLFTREVAGQRQAVVSGWCILQSLAWAAAVSRPLLVPPTPGSPCVWQG